MFTYGKLAQAGIAAVSYLSESGSSDRLVSSKEIAEARLLSHMLVSKILWMLSAGGIIQGKSGPTGGYRLIRPASEISVLDVLRVFEDTEEQVMCPFGRNWCGIGPACPMHETFCELHDYVLDRLGKETFDQFTDTSRGALPDIAALVNSAKKSKESKKDA